MLYRSRVPVLFLQEDLHQLLLIQMEINKPHHKLFPCRIGIDNCNYRKANFTALYDEIFISN